jgi:small subunit ribosomal protein S4
MSEYGTQLREKQKCRRIYGVLENQFHRYYKKASNMRGVTGENLLVLLESRLDNVLFRIGFGASRAQSRQFVMHGHVRVNDKKVDIPSYRVSEGDVITLRERSRDLDHFKALREGTGRIIPKWLVFDPQNLTAKVEAMPRREDIDQVINEQLIVEYYSR